MVFYMKSQKVKIICPAFPDCPKEPGIDKEECKFCPYLKIKKLIKEKKVKKEKRIKLKIGDMVKLNNYYKKEIINEYDESVLNQVFEIIEINNEWAICEEEMNVKINVPISYLKKM